jgi:hypothetical protein
MCRNTESPGKGDMGVCYRLRREIEDLFPPRTTPEERIVGLLIADRARRATRIAVIDTDVIYSRTGLDKRSLQKALRHLRDNRHLEFRMSSGTGSDGRPVYAFRGVPPQYRVPLADEFRIAWQLAGEQIAELPDSPWGTR